MKLTLVPLLLTLHLDRQILPALPVNLITLRMIVDEVTTIPVLFLVEVRLRNGLVREELIVRELEDQTETRTIEIFHADVGEPLQRLLIAICDGLRERRVLHRTKPELWDALHVCFGSV